MVMASQMKNRVMVSTKKVLIVSLVSFFLLPFVLFGLLLIACWWDTRSWENSIDGCQQIGNEIVAALEQYHRDHSKYPDDLSALCPHYLPSIPPHLVGNRQWDYYSTDGDRFSLTFTQAALVGSNEWCTYYSNTKRWVLEYF